MYYFFPRNLSVFGWLFVLCFLVFVGAVGYLLKTRARQKLAKAVMSLGNMRGKHYDEFVAALGEPAERKRVQAEDKMVTNVTWRAGGYEIVIMFDDDDRVVKVVSEALN